MNVARMPNEVKNQVHTDSFNAKDAAPMDRKSKGAITGHLNEAFGGDSARHLALAWLFGYLGTTTPSDPDTYITGLSTKSLYESDWWALYLWIGAYKDEETGEWKARVEFPLEASLVLMEAMKAYNALPVDRKKEDPSFVTSMVAHGVALGGVITSIERSDGSYPDNSDVALPAQLQEQPKPKRLFEPPPTADF